MKIIKFSQKVCSPCQALSMFMKSEGLVADESYVIFGDDEVATKKAQEYGVFSVPSLLLVGDAGNVKERVNGFNPVAVEELFDLKNEVQ